MSPVARGALYGGAYLFKIGACTVGGGLTIALSATRFMLPTALGGGGTPSGALADAIANDFGSVDRWRTEFSAMGKAIGGGSG